MDVATMIGIGIAVGAWFVSVILEGGNPASILLLPPMIIVIGGTIGVTMATGLMKDASAAVKALPRAFAGKSVDPERSEEHTSELQSLMRITFAVFCLKKKI